MKKLIGFLVLACLVIVSSSAFAAELNIGARYYTKFLSKNTYDNTKYLQTGDGIGARSELALNLNGKVSDRCEMGARILSVWDGPMWDWGSHSFKDPGIYADWSSWYNETGNLYQLRGVWAKFYPATIPTLKSVLLGATDRGMFNEWTIGKARYTDRDNAKIIYAEGAIGKVNYGIATFPMAQLPWMAPNWNIGDAPRSDWGTGWNLAFSPMQALNLRVNASHVLALDTDPADKTKATTRFDNSVETLDISFQPNPVYNIGGLIGYSNFAYDPVTSTPSWPIPHANTTGLALKLRALADDPLGVGLTLKGEAFSVSPDFVSIYAPRQEGNVLLSEGHVRYAVGQTGSTWRGFVNFTPSPVPTDEFTDWNEAHNVSIQGQNGLAFIPEFRRGALGIKGEVSMMQNGLNSQSVDIVKYPYSAPKVNQSNMLAAVRADYLLPLGNGLNIFGKYKMNNWTDGVDTSIAADDIALEDTEMYAGTSYQLTDEIGLTGGYKTLSYINKLGGTKNAEFAGGMVFAEAKVNVGGADIGWVYEKVDGENKLPTVTKVNDMRVKAYVEVNI